MGNLISNYWQDNIMPAFFEASNYESYIKDNIKRGHYQGLLEEDIKRGEYQELELVGHNDNMINQLIEIRDNVKTFMKYISDINDNVKRAEYRRIELITQLRSTKSKHARLSYQKRA